jgi:hypothetical protein
MRSLPMRLLVPALALLAGACAAPGATVAGDVALNPEPPAPILQISVLAGDDGGALPGASVTIDRELLTTSDAGTVEVEWRDEPLQFAVAAGGFEASAGSVDAYPEETGAVDIVLDPLILEGTVVGPDGRGLRATTVEMNGSTAVTDETGTFRLTRATAGTVAASRPAWEPATAQWDGESPTVQVQMAPMDIHALRVSGDKAADPEVWAHLLEIADNSEVNAFVVDTKDESGWVFRASDVPEVAEIGALNESFMYDVEQVLADMDAHDLYKITRVTTFQDNFLARAYPDLGVRNENTGDLWINHKGIRWLDATDRDSWEYPLALAVESCELGFDEIQFDYVRFPSDGDISTIETDGGYNEEVRIETIKAFLDEAYSRLNPLGCAVAADIFAITLTSDDDEGIGQRPEVLSESVDVLSPMIYTYTYGRGWNGFENPNEQPVEIVSLALDAGIPRLQGSAIYRPWIQTWQLDAGEILSVQDVVTERDLGWMIWSANTIYDLSFLRPG